MSNMVIMLIVGMALVTYIPRAIPAVLLDKLKFKAKMEKFLQLIPYTAMAALIFPNILWVDESNLTIGLLGALTAAVLAWVRMPIIVVVICAIAVDMALYAFIF